MTKVTAAAAGKQLQVPKDNIDQGLQYWGGIAARENAEAKKAEALKKKEDAAARNKAFKDTELKDDAFKTTVTGFDSRDDVVRNFASTAIEGYTNIGVKAREAYDKGDYKSYKSFLDEQQKVLSQFKNLTNNEEHLAKVNENYVKLANEGKISPVDNEWEGLMESIAQHNFVYSLDERNNPVVEALIKDSEGNESKMKVKVSDLVNGNYRPYENVEMAGDEGLVNSWLSGFGKRVKNEATGNWETTKQVWDDLNERALEAKLDVVMGDKRVMSSLLYQASRGTIKKKGDAERYGEQDSYTKEDKQLVKDFVTRQIKAAYDEEDSRKYTGEAEDLKLKKGTLAERVRHNKAMEALKRAANKKGRALTPKEQEFSIRRFDINEVIRNNDVESFKTGDFTWEGKIHSATDASVVGDRLIITTSKGDKIPVALEERALNDIFNAYEGKSMKYDSVMSVEENSYRDTREGEVLTVDSVLDKFYDESGNATVDDEDMMKALKQAFGAEVEDNFTWDGNSLIVNGKAVDTSNKTTLKRDLTAALKIKPRSKTNKKSDPLGLGI